MDILIAIVLAILAERTTKIWDWALCKLSPAQFMAAYAAMVVKHPDYALILDRHLGRSIFYRERLLVLKVIGDVSGSLMETAFNYPKVTAEQLVQITDNRTNTFSYPVKMVRPTRYFAHNPFRQFERHKVDFFNRAQFKISITVPAIQPAVVASLLYLRHRQGVSNFSLSSCYPNASTMMEAISNSQLPEFVAVSTSGMMFSERGVSTNYEIPFNLYKTTQLLLKCRKSFDEDTDVVYYCPGTSAQEQVFNCHGVRPDAQLFEVSLAGISEVARALSQREGLLVWEPAASAFLTERDGMERNIVRSVPRGKYNFTVSMFQIKREREPHEQIACSVFLELFAAAWHALRKTPELAVSVLLEDPEYMGDFWASALLSGSIPMLGEENFHVPNPRPF